MQNCLFCKIIAGEIPSEKVFENENVVGFKDIHPSAKIHNLFIHKEHTSNVNSMSENSPEQLAQVFAAIRDWTRQENLEKSGFRVVTNCGADAGQTVFHTHFHVLSGERLRGFGAGR